MKKLGKKGAVTGGDGETQRWIDERYPEVQVQVQRMPWNLDCNGPASQPASPESPDCTKSPEREKHCQLTV